jgi:hypothetical protein
LAALEKEIEDKRVIFDGLTKDMYVHILFAAYYY